MREIRVGEGTLRLIQGDITTVKADAIVNAANASLSGGGGVDGAIHRAGGPSIMEECRRIGGCPTGSAVITGAGRLSAKYVIHAVAPIWRGGKAGEEQLLESAYRKSLELANQHSVHSIAFPSLGTGAYGYPLHLAAPVALRVSIEHLQSGKEPQDITFVLWGNDAMAAFESALDALAKEKNLVA